MTDSKDNLPALASQVEPETKAERKLLDAARTPDERAFAYNALSIYRRQKLVQESAALIHSNTMWGKNLSEKARAAIAAYCWETGTDPVRHWYVLGDRLYDNAELWMDLVASSEDFIGADYRYIHADARCEPEEAKWRAAQRVQHGVPEDTPGAAIVTIRTRNRGDFIGVNWIKMHKTAENKWKDSIGHQEPTLTALTRAWRKAAKKGFTLWFMKHPLTARLGAVLEQDHGVAIDTTRRDAIGVPGDDVKVEPTAEG